MYRWLTVVIILICGLTTMNLWAKEIIHDPEFIRMEKEFGEQWTKDDKLVQKKLEALEEKFGKKPNIVFILADDVAVSYTHLTLPTKRIV